MKRKILILAALFMLLTSCGTKASEIKQPVPVPQTDAPSAPAEEGPDTPDFSGLWRDEGTSGGRCYMEITRTDEEYTIDIYWGSSASETHHWQLFGTYDESEDEIAYIGTHYLETALEDGELRQTVMLKGLTGSIWPDDDGTLRWTDNNEQSGEGMVFEQET